MRAALIIIAMSLSACAYQQYWVRPGTNLQQTSTDLLECRLKANQGDGGQKVVSTTGIEYPCMGSKGYTLSMYPPSK